MRALTRIGFVGLLSLGALTHIESTAHAGLPSFPRPGSSTSSNNSAPSSSADIAGCPLDVRNLSSFRSCIDRKIDERVNAAKSTVATANVPGLSSPLVLRALQCVQRHPVGSSVYHPKNLVESVLRNPSDAMRTMIGTFVDMAKVSQIRFDPKTLATSTSPALKATTDSMLTGFKEFSRRDPLASCLYGIIEPELQKVSAAALAKWAEVEPKLRVALENAAKEAAAKAGAIAIDFAVDKLGKLLDDESSSVVLQSLMSKHLLNTDEMKARTAAVQALSTAIKTGQGASIDAAVAKAHATLAEKPANHHEVLVEAALTAALRILTIQGVNLAMPKVYTLMTRSIDMSMKVAAWVLQSACGAGIWCVEWACSLGTEISRTSLDAFYETARDPVVDKFMKPLAKLAALKIVDLIVAKTMSLYKKQAAPQVDAALNKQFEMLPDRGAAVRNFTERLLFNIASGFIRDHVEATRAYNTSVRNLIDATMKKK